MSGKAITPEQVKLFMKHRTKGDTQQQAGAKAGISERSARRIDSGVLPRKREPRHWRTRKDPFVTVWVSEILPLLEKAPTLAPTTLFEDLQDRHPGHFSNKLKRTFQRRVKDWKALHGPDKEVMFRQSKQAGRLGLSDFTDLNDINITIAGELLNHRLYHFRLPYSGWSHIKVILGGESYTALAEGLQEALQRLGGAPKEHRTDSLSAAYKNLSKSEQEDLTERYQSLCEHYGMTPTRNNRGVSHENGAVESPHGHIKNRIRQALLLRESHDFVSLDDYRQWLDGLIRRFNRRCDDALEIERDKLLALPIHNATDYTEQVVKVTSSSTIDVRRVLYSVPARLAGESLRLHIYDDRIEAYVGSTLAHTLTRAYTLNHNQRARCIDYRHLIGQLVRKPQAFRYSQLRDDLLPNATYQQIWVAIDQQLDPRAACKRIVGILSLATRADCEQPLGAYLQQQIAKDNLPSLHQLEQRFDPHASSALSDGLEESCAQHPLSAYDALMPTAMEAH
ncbi:MAG: IS21 family transposase [Halieaceae bacterium]|nr:IS21 family transposase [Halieaceae bacterium]